MRHHDTIAIYASILRTVPQRHLDFCLFFCLSELRFWRICDSCMAHPGYKCRCGHSLLPSIWVACAHQAFSWNAHVRIDPRMPHTWSQHVPPAWLVAEFEETDGDKRMTGQSLHGGRGFTCYFALCVCFFKFYLEGTKPSPDTSSDSHCISPLPCPFL